MQGDIVPGVTFPDHELSDHTGKHRKLSELQGHNSTRPPRQRLPSSLLIENASD